MAGGTQFPAYLSLRTERDGSAKATLLAELNEILGSAEGRVTQFSNEIKGMMQKALSVKGGNLDLGLSGLRENLANLDLAANKVTTLRDAAINLAKQTGDTSQATKSYIDALRMEAREAEEARRAAQAQVETYTKLQTATDEMVAANARLAQSYRETFAEQARAANLADASQKLFNTYSAPGLDRMPASRNGATTSALAEMIEQERLAERATAELRIEMQRLTQAIDPAAAAQERFEMSTRQVNEALQRGIITEAQAVRMHQLLGAEMQRNAGGTGQMRQAQVMLGQQMQDMVIQAQMGTSAITIFTQQVPQAALALSGLQGRIGQVATFLSGPWGAAIFMATALLGPFIANLFSAGEESDKLGSKSLTLADALDKVRFGTKEAQQALADYNAEQDRARKSTEDMIAINLASAEARLKEAMATREQLKAEMERAEFSARANAGQGTGGAAGAYSGGAAFGAQARLQEQDKAIADLNKSIANLRIENADRNARRSADPRFDIQARYEDERAKLSRDVAAGLIKVDEYQRRRAKSLMDEKAALEAYDKANRKSRSTRERGPDTRLEAFGAPLGPGMGRVTGGFGDNRSTHRHAGVDIAARTGTPVYATQDGNVVFADKAGAYGNLVKISHGAGTETRYGHLSGFNVRDGQMVRKGDTIGYVGSTGRSTGSHLHYEVRVNGKPVDPSKGKFPVDASAVAAEAQKAQQELEQFGQRSAEKIMRINEAFDEQPKLIDRAYQATRELDKTIADLTERKPVGWEQMVADAKAAKATVEDSLVRPFREMEADANKRVQLARLTAMGREEEAEALDRIWALEERLGPLTEERKNQVRDVVRYEREAMEALRGHREIMDAYLGAVSSARGEIEAILSGQGKMANFGQIFRQMQGKILTEMIFGPALRSLEDFVKKNTFGDAVDDLEAGTRDATTALESLTGAFLNAASRLTEMRAPVIGGAARSAGTGLGALYAGLTGSANDNDIVVMGGMVSTKRGARPNMTPEQFVNELSTSIVKPMLAGFDDIFGVQFFSKMQGVLSGAFSGYMTGGATGGILGALKGIDGLPEGISKALGKMGAGAATGSLVSGIGGAFGIKMSTGGAQIGGALGSLLKAVPGGDIIGAIAGGLLGNIFGTRPRGAASVTNTGMSASANTGDITNALNASGSSLQDAIKRIADAFGATVGSYDVGLGRYKDYYQVSSSANDPKLGNSYFGRDSKNALYDGLDAEAAMRAAILAALQDGAIAGIRAGTKKLLQAGKDLDQQLQKALDFESVFTRLKTIKDPVGAALDALDKEFKRLKDIFAEAGASTEEYAQLEELYGIERAKAIKEANDQITGSLRSLYEALTIGDSGLSLRERLSNAKAAYDPLKARVEAGDVTAYDDFAKAAQDLLDLQRQIYGSQTPYFDLLAEITSLTKSRLDAAQAIADASAGRDSPFTQVSGGTAANDNSAVVGAIGQTNDILNQINTNLSQLGNLIAAGGGGGIVEMRLPNQVQYY